MTRQIPFEGDDAAYILFLEARILRLEDSLRQSSQQPTYIGTSSSPADFNGVRNQDEVFEKPHHHRRQIHIAPETQSPDGDTEPAPEDFDEQGRTHKDGGNPFIEYNPKVQLDPNRTVTLEKTEDKDGVHAVMRKVLGSAASSKQLVKLVRGAKWANSLVSLLSKTKWASRSWDILCVAQRPVSFYARLNDCSVDPKEVLESMGTNVHESLFLPESIDSPAPFAIPLIVKRIFKNSKSLKVICECLGYELSSITKTNGLSVILLAGSISELKALFYQKSEDITGQLSPVGPAKHSALSEDVADLSSAVLPIPSSITRPPGTADALSDFCPESNAGTASVISLCSKTPEHTLRESKDSETLHPTSMDSFLSLQQETLNQPLPSEFPFNPRETLYPASIDSLLSLQQETLNQPLPSESPFNPRETLYPASIDSLLSLQQETLNQPLPSEFPFNPRETLYPASIDSLLSLQQETLNQALPSGFPFNPRETLYPASIDSLLSLQQETLEQLLPSEFPFNPREALHTSSTALFPRGVAQAPLPEQEATWRSDIMSDPSRTVKQPPQFFPNELQLGYPENTLSSVSLSSC
ncbi:hypothetical protein E8E15_002461 [Penicillium rubens]|nr:hypothetical protein E8E15_002461 [Penicillium rubens]